jgi:hypothetical protein
LIGAGTVNIRSRGSGPTDHNTVSCYFPIPDPRKCRFSIVPRQDWAVAGKPLSKMRHPQYRPGHQQVTLRRVAAMLAKIPRAPSGLACMSTCPLRFIASHEATTEMFTRSSNRLGGALPEKEPRISQWRPFRMLLGVRIHVIPRLRARCKDIHRWVMDRGIVQAARLQTENIWQSLKFHDH